ncbi:hypothetical protein [Sulfitobacter sp. 1A12057]|uniref:hypothetical protein n=1 Tax=Sulfitobacter sp. 1A12057 TaxID=3368567 RepID=UPI00374656DE
MVAEEGDPALDAFLGFIEADIKMHPEGLQALNGGLHDRLKAYPLAVNFNALV